MQLKQCKKCKKLKLVNFDFRMDWYERNKRFYIKNMCLDCIHSFRKENYYHDIDNKRKINTKSYLKNKEKILARARKRDKLRYKEKKQYRQLHKYHYNMLNKKHYNNNKDYYLNRNKVRRALKINKTPINLSRYNKCRTDFIYKTCRQLNNHFDNIMFEVDHIVPLTKDGLHHPDNLQIILKDDNLSKGNKLNYELKFGYCFKI